MCTGDFQERAELISASLQAEPEKSVRDDVGTKLKHEFHFDPSLRAKEMNAPKNEILVLEKITVTKSAIQWDLFEQTMIQAHQKRLKETAFTLREGGPFVTKDFGKVRAQIGLWGEGGGVTFLKFKW